MPDDQTQTPNPIPTENSIPPSPPAVAESYGEALQEPIPPSHKATEGQGEPVTLNTGISEPSTMPPEALESPQNAESAVPVNNANPQNEPISTPILEEAIPL